MARTLELEIMAGRVMLLDGLRINGMMLGQCASAFATATGIIPVLVNEVLLVARPTFSWVKGVTRTAVGIICGMLFMSAWTQIMGERVMVDK